MKLLLYSLCVLSLVCAAQENEQPCTFLTKEWFVVEPALCNVTCLNDGYCNPDSHQCVCTSNCRGVMCEKCSWNIPFGAIVAFFVGLVIVWYVCIWVADLITRKCRWPFDWLQWELGFTDAFRCTIPLWITYSRSVHLHRTRILRLEISLCLLWRVQLSVGIAITKGNVAFTVFQILFRFFLFVYTVCCALWEMDPISFFTQ